MGRPRNATVFAASLKSIAERRRWPRFRVALNVRIALASPLTGGRVDEFATTQVVSTNGAEVECSLEIIEGGAVLFEVLATGPHPEPHAVRFRTRAEIVSIRSAAMGRRVAGIRFVGNQLPPELIPSDALEA
jgi:hypothetical protein